MKTFTDAFIKSLVPKDKPYIEREQAPRGEGGFAIRVMPTGKKSWQMVYTFEGTRKWLRLGSYPALSLSKAREKFRKMRSILAEGKDPGEATRTKARERRDAWTVDKLCDEFLEKYCQVKKRPRSAREDKLNLKRDVRPVWGKRKARDIRRGDVVALLDVIVKRGAGVQANRTLACVRKMFAWALEREVVESNPAAGISKPATESPKERNLDLAEIVTVWQNMDARQDVPKGVKQALKLVLLTGCRPGEILDARWEQLDGEWFELPSTNTKTKRPYRVYLSTLAKQIAGEPGTGLIVTKEDGSPLPVYTLSYWLRRCKHFGAEPWSSHDLRRTCATQLAKMGTAPHVTQRILHHAQTGTMGRVYDQYTYAKEIATALEAWSRKLQGLLEGKETDKVVPLVKKG